MERYYLFRGDELVYKCDDNLIGSMGAGDSHALGQDGDILICAREGWIRGWHWNDITLDKSKVGTQMAWLDIPPEKLDTNKYRVLILLQQ